MAPIHRVALLAFPQLTLLDLVGGYDALRRLAPLGIAPVDVRIVGTAPEIVDEGGVVLRPHAVRDDLSSYDLLYVPGGMGTRTLLHDEPFLAWLRTWGETRPVASVCTGSLLLGAAGFLRDLRATTHHGAYELLAPFCRAVVTDRRIVDEGRVVTAAGVSAALDLGLHLVRRFWGDAAHDRIAAQMEYAPRYDG